jgi:hypothetical protein
MSVYRDFIQDFPVRCGEILEEYRKQSEKSDREVTHMLAIASAAIPIPFERLRKQSRGKKHPAGDKEKYPKANSNFNNVCGKKFINSVLWKKEEAGSWEIGEVDARDVKKNPEDPSQWQVCYELLSADLKVKGILVHIRNAIAHGGIFTLSEEKDQIKKIIFLSEILNGRHFTGRYKVLKVSPANFYDFLINWIDFLSSLKLDVVSNPPY